MPDPLTIEQAVFGDLGAELAATRSMLERLPDDAWGFVPHEGMWKLGDLANHLVQVVFWTQTVLDRDAFDAATAGDEGRVIATGRDEALARFDALAANVRAAARESDAAHLAQPWTLRAGPHVIFTKRRADALRRECIGHLVHHRAQLGVYLRLRGIEPPTLYGG